MKNKCAANSKATLEIINSLKEGIEQLEELFEKLVEEPEDILYLQFNLLVHLFGKDVSALLTKKKMRTLPEKEQEIVAHLLKSLKGLLKIMEHYSVYVRFYVMQILFRNISDNIAEAVEKLDSTGSDSN